MPSSIEVMRFFSRSCVKFFSRLLTALNLLPSIATRPSSSRCRLRRRAIRRQQTLRIAGPLSFRKSAIVLKSGVSLPMSHISSTLRWHSRSSRRDDWIWLR